MFSNDEIKKYIKQIYYYCYRMLGNVTEAEDAMQEVLYKAYKSNNGNIIKNTSVWLYKIAYNHCINIQRRKSIIKFISIDNVELHECPSSHEDNSEYSENVQLALNILTSIQRTVIILKAVEGLHYDEISRITGKSNQSLRKHYERGKNKIIEFLSNIKEENL